MFASVRGGLDRSEPTRTLDGGWGMVMTWKEELLMLWILCTVLLTFAARHFLAGAVDLVEQMAAFSIAYVPVLLHVLARRLN